MSQGSQGAAGATRATVATGIGSIKNETEIMFVNKYMFGTSQIYLLPSDHFTGFPVSAPPKHRKLRGKKLAYKR